MDAVSSGLKRRETFQRVISVQFKSQHLWWYGGAYVNTVGSLRVLEGTMNAERYIKVLEQHMLLSRRRLFQQDNAKPHTAAITTAWLFSGWKHISGKNGTKFQHQNSRNSYPRCPDIFKLFWKEEEMLQDGKHAPVPTILRPNLSWAHFLNKIVT